MKLPQIPSAGNLQFQTIYNAIRYNIHIQSPRHIGTCSSSYNSNHLVVDNMKLIDYYSHIGSISGYNLEDQIMNIPSIGNRESYAWPGGYPLFYISKQNNICCPECANREVDQSDEIIAMDINYEDDDLYCDDCGKKIESAYGNE